MQICLFEDNRFNNFLPLVYFRPVFELRCGALSLREKFEQAFPKTKLHLLVRTELVDYLKEDFPKYSINTLPNSDVWFINCRLLSDNNLLKFINRKLTKSQVFLHNNDVAFAFITKNELSRLQENIINKPIERDSFKGIPEEPYSCRLVNYPWDIIHLTADEIEKDFNLLKSKKISGKVHPGVHLINKKKIVIGKGSVIKPGAVLDAEKGPIIIGKNVTIMPNAVIEGPAFIGGNSAIKIGSKIYHGTSIGDYCKVGGEVESSIIQSHSNKQHEGFLGHSYLGSWVNIGADTNTSDLKNNYSNVKVYVNGEMVDSGHQFVGLMMGDHSKTGINVMFNTGTVIGVSCNIYGAGLPPKFVPSFSWGSDKSYTTYDIEKSLETMRRVMVRRNVKLTAPYEMLVRDVFKMTEKERRNAWKK